MSKKKKGACFINQRNVRNNEEEMSIGGSTGNSRPQVLLENNNRLWEYNKTKTPTMDSKVNRRGRFADNYKSSRLREFKSRMDNQRTRMTMTALQKFSRG
jgi:hypothetical protein